MPIQYSTPQYKCTYEDIVVQLKNIELEINMMNNFLKDIVKKIKGIVIEKS